MSINFKKLSPYLICCLLAWQSAGFADDMIHIFPIQDYSQRISDWVAVNDNTTHFISPEQQALRYANFKSHFFGDNSPWSQIYVGPILNPASGETIQQVETDVLAMFTNTSSTTSENIQYAENFHAYDLLGGPQNWANNIGNNMNLAQFASLAYNSANNLIATNNILGRMLPTQDPSFQSYTLGGQGYPFDNLQVSAIWAGTPLYLLGTTRDGKWDLILTDSFFTWVPDNSVARIAADQINNWTNASNFIAITQTQTKVSNSNNQYLFDAYVGSVFPAGPGNNQLLIPVRNDDGSAQVIAANITSNSSVTMPLPATPKNMAMLMSTLKGRPYGWGNMYYYNDCSAELKSLFTPFGVWLPRNSSMQPSQGKVVNLTSNDMNHRIAYLLNNGHALATLINIPGHIMLYTGGYKWMWSFQAMTYQNVWGLRPPASNSMTVYRDVIGGAVFLPLLRQYPEDPNAQSLADKSTFILSYLDQMPSAAKITQPDLKAMAMFPADDS